MTKFKTTACSEAYHDWQDNELRKDLPESLANWTIRNIEELVELNEWGQIERIQSRLDEISSK